ncbi:MAG: S8 family serine peptidase [Chthoniobacteraceae bacterium]
MLTDEFTDGFGKRCAELREQAGLERLRALSTGHPKVRIALLDGPVARDHPCLEMAHLVEEKHRTFSEPSAGATAHATCLASMLLGRDERVLGLCPDCTLISIAIVDRPFFEGKLCPNAAARRICEAIVRAVNLEASVIQMSLQFSPELARPFREVAEAIRFAAMRNVRTVVAAGNLPTLGVSPVLSAPGCVPVGMAGPDGRPHPSSALGVALGTKGLLAPGVDIPSAVPQCGFTLHAGSSCAASFVTATYALVRSLYLDRDNSSIWEAILMSGARRRGSYSIVPPSLNGDRALDALQHPPFDSGNNLSFKLRMS